MESPPSLDKTVRSSEIILFMKIYSWKEPSCVSFLWKSPWDSICFTAALPASGMADQFFVLSLATATSGQTLPVHSTRFGVLVPWWLWLSLALVHLTWRTYLFTPVLTNSLASRPSACPDSLLAAKSRHSARFPNHGLRLGWAELVDQEPCLALL